jgi:hypothetical protein
MVPTLRLAEYAGPSGRLMDDTQSRGGPRLEAAHEVGHAGESQILQRRRREARL